MIIKLDRFAKDNHLRTLEIDEGPGQVEKWSLMENSWILCENMGGLAEDLFSEVAAILDPSSAEYFLAEQGKLRKTADSFIWSGEYQNPMSSQ